MKRLTAENMLYWSATRDVLAIHTTPLYVVTDSLGNVVYTGAEVTQATQKARALVK